MTATDHASDRVTELVARSQQTIVDTVGAVTETWTGVLRGLSSPGLPVVPVAPADVVDRFFDTGVQVLEAQRSLVQGTLDAFRVATSTPGR